MRLGRIFIVPLILAAGSMLGGCAGQGAARVEPVTMAVYPGDCLVKRGPGGAALDRQQASDQRPGAIDLACFRFPEDGDSGKTAYTLTLATDDKGQVARNRLAAILLKQADDICTSEKALLLKRQAEVNGWMSIATTGLATASTIVTGELAKSILSGGAAATSGSRDHINTHVYRNQIIQTVTKAIDTERLRLLETMTPNFGKPTSAYTVDDMVRQVNGYHQACSFGTGLQIVMESVEKRAEFDRMSKLQELDGQIRQLEDVIRNGGAAGLAAGAADAQIATLRKERIRLSTGINVD